MTDRALFPAPDEEPPVSVSQTAASLPRADAPLKPCPFCGGEARMAGTYEYDYYTHFVICDTCDISSIERRHKSDADAIAAWNRRDGEDARIAEAKAQGAAEERARIVAALEETEDHQVMSWGEVTMPVWKVVEIVKGDDA